MWRTIADQLKQVRDLAREGKYFEMFGVLVELQQGIFDIVDGFVRPRAEGGAAQMESPSSEEAREIDASVQELNALGIANSAPTVGAGPDAGPDPVTGNPAAIFAIIQGVLQLLDFIRRRRNPEPAPAANSGGIENFDNATPAAEGEEASGENPSAPRKRGKKTDTPE